MRSSTFHNGLRKAVWHRYVLRDSVSDKVLNDKSNDTRNVKLIVKEMNILIEKCSKLSVLIKFVVCEHDAKFEAKSV